MKRLALAFLLATAPAFAQEPAAPEPVAVVEVEIPVAVVEKLSVSDTATLEKATADNASAVASGDATIAEASRDPAESVDFGASWQMGVLAALFMAVVAPWTVILLKKLGIVAPELGGAASMTVAVIYYLAAWYFLKDRYPTFPQDPLAWVGIAIAGSSIGSTVRSLKNNLPTVFRRQAAGE